MSGAKRILLVDDDDDLREALAEQLVITAEFDVTEAGSGKDAMVAIKVGEFDIVAYFLQFLKVYYLLL